MSECQPKCPWCSTAKHVRPSGNVCQSLQEHAGALGIVWGWGEDSATIGYPWVLYAEIPTGQVSFHSPVRGDGPDYPGAWDKQREASSDRIVRWTQGLLDTHPEVEAIQGPDRSAAVTDVTPMPWGVHRGKPLAEVPGDYWLWFRSQAWAHKWPGLLEYARSIKEEAAA